MTRTKNLLVLFLFMMMLAHTAWGQGQLTTAVAPARVEQLVNPGSKVEDVITFTNQGNVPLTVSISIVDFDVDEVGMVTELPPGSHSSTVAPYFRISPLRTIVGPQEQAHFRVYRSDAGRLRADARLHLLRLPAGCRRGGGQTGSVCDGDGDPVYVESRKAQRGELTVHDIAWERAEDQEDFLELKLHVTNEGQRNIRPGGFLSVRSSDDRFAETFDVNVGGDVVLPGHERHLTMRFGPVPSEVLSLKLRFETSVRSNYQNEHQMPRLEAAEEGER